MEVQTDENGPDRISIHALREEGDALIDRFAAHDLKFLSTPSARRATEIGKICALHGYISIHALREEGDGRLLQKATPTGHFYPRPPRGGRQVPLEVLQTKYGISIHALREEGDLAGWDVQMGLPKFLSTPSARRATIIRKRIYKTFGIFLSTPSARRATN